MECEAGRELDALVAERIFGRKSTVRLIYFLHGGEGEIEIAEGRDQPTSGREALEPIYDDQLYLAYPTYDEAVVPYYSTVLAMSWLVVEKIQERGEIIHIEWWPGLERLAVDASWKVMLKVTLDHLYPRHAEQVSAHTAPLAICLAGLKAMEVKS